MTGKPRVVAGSNPATATDNVKMVFPPGTDTKRKRCLRRTAKTSFLVTLAHHSELRGIPIFLKATNSIEDGSAGRAVYRMGYKVNGSISVVLPDCDGRCSNLCPKKQSFGKVCKHECTHIATRKIWGMKKIPSWVEEGYAEWVANGPSGEAEALLIMRTVTVPFSEKDMYQAFSRLDAYHYKLFYLMFVFLSKQDGRIKDFIYKTGRTNWQKALYAVYGLTPEDMHREFFQYLATSKKTSFLESILNEVRGWIQV